MIFVLLFTFQASFLPKTNAQADETKIIEPTDKTTKSDSTCDPAKGYCLLEPLPGMGEQVNTNQGIGAYLNQIIKFVIGFAGALAVIMMVVGGIQYMSTDAMSGKEDGKEMIQNALIGLGLALCSFLLLYTIDPNLTHINLEVPKVSVNVKEDSDYKSLSSTFSGGGGAFFGDTAGGNPNVTKNITSYDTQLSSATQKYNPPSCTLLKAFMYAESGGNPSAQSSVGAVGLIQLMPKTASGLGYNGNLTDPAVNTEAAAKYINQLYKNACNGNTTLGSCTVSDMQYVIAAYNGGPGANQQSKDCPGQTWWQCEANPGYKETRGYVKRVTANFQKLTNNKWGCNK